MMNRFNKVLAVATISLVSANVSAGHKANSYYPLKSKSHSYSSPFNFLAWGLFSRLESIQSGVDANTLAIEDNKSAIATLEDSLTEPVIAIGSVTLDVDCNENGSALAEAYAANTTATQLRLNIVGECYGDFQSTLKIEI